MSHRSKIWLIINLAFAVMFLGFAWVALVFGSTDWPFLPLQMSLLVLAATACTLSSRNVKIGLILMWALVACPWTLKTDKLSALPQSTEVAHGFSSTEKYSVGDLDHLQIKTHRVGPENAVNLQSFVSGTHKMWLSKIDWVYLDGEAGYDGADLVAYTISWFPYPNFDRITVSELDSHDSTLWDPSSVSVSKQGNSLFVAGGKFKESCCPVNKKLVARQAKVFTSGWSQDGLVWAGWILIVLSYFVVWFRRTGRHQAAETVS